ncbi:hypothetical protein Tco_0666265 [Tanacetum coccineum]
MRIELSLKLTFDKSLPEPKSSPSIEDDRINEPVGQDPIRSPSLEVNALEPSDPKSVRDHIIEQVIGELNKRTLRIEKKRKELDANIQTTHVVKWNSLKLNSVLRRLGSIFTSVYAAKLKRVVSLLKGLQDGKNIALCQKE